MVPRRSVPGVFDVRPAKKSRLETPKSSRIVLEQTKALMKTPTSAQVQAIESSITDENVSTEARTIPATIPSMQTISSMRPVNANEGLPNEDSSVDLPDHLLHLKLKYAFVSVAIKSGSKIEQRVAQVISHALRFEKALESQAGVVVLSSLLEGAQKLVSVLEIAKREMVKGDPTARWYQYTRVYGELREIPRSGKKKSKSQSRKQNVTERSKLADGSDLMKDDVVDDSMNGDEEEPAFETLGDLSNRPVKPTKLRNMPKLIIYLARVRIPELRLEFGEQTNAPG